MYKTPTVSLYDIDTEENLKKRDDYQASSGVMKSVFFSTILTYLNP